MNYKNAINEQIETLQKRQKEILKNGIPKSEELCLIASTITELATKATLIPEGGE